MSHWTDSTFTAAAVAFLCCVMALIMRQAWPRLRRMDLAAEVAAFVAPALLLPSWPLAGSLLVLACVAAAVTWRWRFLHPVGAAAVTLAAALSLLSVVSLGGFVFGNGFSPLTRAMLLVVFVLLLLMLPSVLWCEYMLLEWMCRDAWTRPHLPFARPVRTGPMVSVHVPCYAEPPDVVVATLNTLNRLDYDDFEVIVVDNNTKDPGLWRPIEQHCRDLGGRFRFFHVDPLAGAKGGALNFALAQTHPDAELIALVDADHQVEPGFLTDLVGHFTDPRLAVVQTLYDFRGWRGRRFLTACFWAYRIAFPTVMRWVAERGAAFPMGTMCLLRRSAVEHVGGWSERVVTEDSELGLRLQAAGYTSLLLETSCGKGLIPERFADFAGQRFRWVYGPVQTFKQHWRSLVPALRSSRLSRTQRFVHLQLSVGQARMALMYLAAPAAITGMFSMIANGESWPISRNTVLALVVAVVALPALRLSVCRYAAGSRWRDAVSAVLAVAALQFTCVLAVGSSLATATTSWRRTNKFKVTSSGWRALRAVRAELVIGTITVCAGVAGLVVDHTGILLLIELALVLQGGRTLAAPAAVVLSDRELRAGGAERGGTAPDRGCREGHQQRPHAGLEASVRAFPRT